MSDTCVSAPQAAGDLPVSAYEDRFQAGKTRSCLLNWASKCRFRRLLVYEEAGTPNQAASQGVSA